MQTIFSQQQTPGIATIDAKGNVIRQNEAFKRLFHLPDEGVQGINIYYEPALHQFAAEALTCFEQGKNRNGALTIEGEDGRPCRIHYSLFPIFNRQLQVENALATFKETNVADTEAFSTVGLSLWSYDSRNGVFRFTERAAKALEAPCKFSFSERFDAAIARIHKEDRAHLLRRLRRPDVHSAVDFRIATSSGEKWIRAETTDLRGDIWSGQLSDITEWKQKEADGQRSNEEMESFMYKSAHNLKGPAGSIHALTEIAMSEVKEDAARKYLKLINRSSERLEMIINDLLNLNQIKQGKLEIVDIDLEEIIHSVRESLKFLAGSDEIEFRIRLHHTGVFRSDRRYIYSIFQNFIENAIKYKRADGAFLELETSDESGGIRMTFRDNGIGIQEDALEKIFEMFYRATSAQYGSGLGLYIVQNAVSKLGGNIKVESKLGKGTAFTLFLPPLSK